jgi:hypothetical protein
MPLRGNLTPEADQKVLSTLASNPPSYTTSQINDLESKITGRLEGKLESQLAEMWAYSAKMLEVMQEQAARFWDIQSQNETAAGAPASTKKTEKGHRNQWWYGVNQGWQAGVYASAKLARKAAAKFNGTPSAVVRHFNTEDEAWAWVDLGDLDTSGSINSDVGSDSEVGRSDKRAKVPVVVSQTTRVRTWRPKSHAGEEQSRRRTRPSHSSSPMEISCRQGGRNLRGWAQHGSADD